MANRPVFQPYHKAPFYVQCNTEFVYSPGFSLKQNQKSIHSLHQAFLTAKPRNSILEISSKSPDPLGVSLSAFNLTVDTHVYGSKSVETLYQAGKVFSDGRDNLEVLEMSSAEAKKYIKSLAPTPLKCYRFAGREFPLEPQSFFYDWLYILALTQHPELALKLMAYTAFTDIVFTPAKSLNCQARAAAVYTALNKAGFLETAMESPEQFRRITYGE